MLSTLYQFVFIIFIPKYNIKIERIIVTLTLFNSQSRKSIDSLSCAGALVFIYKCYIFAKFIFKICNQFVVGIGLFHLISVPPLSRIHVFHSYTPEEFQAQNLLPLKNSKIPSSKPFTPEEFQAQNLSPPKNSKIPSSKPFTPEEFQAQNL